MGRALLIKKLSFISLSMKFHLKKWFKNIFFALFIALILRFLVVESFCVRSISMQNTLYEGDYIFVEKFSYGARTPATLLSLPFFRKHLPFSKTPSYLTWLELPIFRLPSFSKVKRNDVVIFNYPKETNLPIDKRKLCIKRCIAVSGEVLEIKNKNIIIENDTLLFPKNSIFKYRIVTNGTEIKGYKKEFYNIKGLKLHTYELALTKRNAEIMQNMPFVLNFKESKLEKDIIDENIFPKSEYKWNRDFYGKILVPKEGLKIRLNKKNIDIYKDIIEIHEENKLKIKGDTIFINNKQTDNYTFKQNYYFVLDDNRDYGNDSRYWGFVPENHIVGKASYIWYSRNKNKIRWNRFFKKID